MLPCNFSGNMGNSIIQYAITRTVADKNGYEFGFNPTFNYDYHNGYNQLEFLDLDYGHVHNASFHECPDGVDYVWYEKYETIKYDNGDIVDYHPLQLNVFAIPDGTKLVVRCMQDARYYDKTKLQNWIKIKKENQQKYCQQLKNWGIELDENLTVLNIRGGEYLGYGL